METEGEDYLDYLEIESFHYATEGEDYLNYLEREELTLLKLRARNT